MKRAILAILIMLVWAMPSRAATVVLDYYSVTGFESGSLGGQPIHFVVTLNGDTGSGNGFSAQYHFQNVETVVSLTVGTTQVFLTGLNSNVFMAQDEGLDHISFTIAGVHTIFSSEFSEGPLFGSFPIDATPSAIDQYLLFGTFIPRAFSPYFQESFIVYDGHNADLSSLQISAIPLPGALPLLSGGLGLIGWIAKRGRGKAAHA